jgi:hypothetical protein
MTRSDGSCLSGDLFARKGEAVPSGANGLRNGALTMFSGSSPLSFLIQRRNAPAGEGDTVDQKPKEAAADAAPLWPTNDTEEYVTRPLVSADAAKGAAAPAAPVDWKRVSFRIEADNYRHLKNLAGLWGVSGQSLIHKAVSMFLDGTVTNNDGSWEN